MRQDVLSSTVPRLVLRGITKRYPGVLANDQVHLSVQPGEIHAVLGENGAGKSTLMKIIYGSVKPDEGSMAFDGVPLSVRDPQAARALGISMVFQHFSLFDTLSVAENVWLGLDRRFSLQQVIDNINKKANEYGLDIDPMRPVHTLSVGEMQRVEIIRALLSEPRLLILDEPTSVLTPQAVEKLFLVLRQLAAQGCSILYISHKLHEIRELCTACTVMRAGQVTGQCDPREESNESLSRLMIGEAPMTLQRRQLNPGAAMLRLNDLNLSRKEPFGVDLYDLNLTVHAGEIVGIAGVSGNGQAELLYALSGEDTRAAHHSIEIESQPVGKLNASQRRAVGLHFVPEERLGRGAVPSMSLAENLLLTRQEAVNAWGWVNPRRLRSQAQAIIEKFQVKAAGPHAAAKSLSGGNLQKFIMGREIGAQPKLLIVSQPTWGVDVGAAAQIRAALLSLRDAGCAVLVVSEELDELFEICDYLHVIAKGHLSPRVHRHDTSTETMGLWMSGLWHEQVQGHLQELEHQQEVGHVPNNNKVEEDTYAQA